MSYSKRTERSRRRKPIPQTYTEESSTIDAGDVPDSCKSCNLTLY